MSSFNSQDLNFGEGLDTDLFAELDLDAISMSLGDIADNTDEIVDLLADFL